MLACWTDLPALNDTETGIKHATGNWIICLVRLIGDHLHHRTTEDLFRRSDPKLNANNRHCILIRLSRNIFYDPFCPNISRLEVRWTNSLPHAIWLTIGVLPVQFLS